MPNRYIAEKASVVGVWCVEFAIQTMLNFAFFGKGGKKMTLRKFFSRSYVILSFVFLIKKGGRPVTQNPKNICFSVLVFLFLNYHYHDIR